MQRVHVFYPDEDDKITFTKQELENLINEIYDEGYLEGRLKLDYWSITSPYYTYTTGNQTDNYPLHIKYEYEPTEAEAETKTTHQDSSYTAFDLDSLVDHIKSLL